jgi:hypothetical protein
MCHATVEGNATNTTTLCLLTISVKCKKIIGKMDSRKVINTKKLLKHRQCVLIQIFYYVLIKMTEKARF